MNDLPSRVAQLASDATFNRPLVTNIFRGIIAEAIVSLALPDWRWVSADYSPYDFEHPDGTKLEVKQSSLRQSWVTAKPSVPSWDIAARTGSYGDDGWLPKVGRNADIYVLALHGTTDDTTDHRDPDQWCFFVIPTAQLPSTKRLGVNAATRIAGGAVRFAELASTVRKVKSDQ